MPPQTCPAAFGPVGLMIPPMPSAAPVDPEGRTSSTTNVRTFGTTEWITSICAQAESAGAGALWASDHLFWRRPAGECMTTLAVAASVLRRAALGTCVLQLPLRQPSAVAKQAAALQVLSGGRFVLGVGVGSHRGEYDAAGASFAGRGHALDAGIVAVRQAWSTGTGEAGTGEAGTGEGGTGDYRLAPALPAPVWVGGSSPAARRRAATLADGWVPLFLDPARFGTGVREVRDLAAAAGRDPSAIVAAVVMVASPGADAARAERSGLAWLADLYGLPPKAFARHLVAGPPERCAEVVAAYHDAGAAHVVVMVAGDDAPGGFASIASLVGRTGGREPSPAIEMAGARA